MKEDFDLTSYALFVLMLGDCQKLAQLRCFEGYGWQGWQGLGTQISLA
tara:strand:+ start:398 stop:541 length:144 start_codon:yes stop_codon:yes gene_type:complete